MLAVSGQDGGGVAPRLAGVPGLAQVRIDSANQCYLVLTSAIQCNMHIIHYFYNQVRWPGAARQPPGPGV